MDIFKEDSMMKKEKTSEIRVKENLNSDEYSLVKSLEEFCQKRDQTSLKLELEYKMMGNSESHEKEAQHFNEFLYYIKNQLVGYLGICSFGSSTLEVNGMVHPDYRRQGIFTELFDEVSKEWKKRKKPKMLLLTDAQSISGKGFINSLDVTYDHAEYEMYYNKEVSRTGQVNKVLLRKATNDDAEEIRRQNAFYFIDEESSNREMGEDPYKNYNIEDVELILPEEEEEKGMRIFIAEVDNHIVGKVNLHVSESAGGIYGLGVLPDKRRKGYGKQILQLAVKILQEMECQEIFLQVNAKNVHALDLYKGVGFEVTSTMEYYRYGMDRKK